MKTPLTTCDRCLRFREGYDEDKSNGYCGMDFTQVNGGMCIRNNRRRDCENFKPKWKLKYIQTELFDCD